MMRAWWIGTAALVLCACSDSAGTKPGRDAGLSEVDAGPGADPFASGAELRVSVPAEGRAYVNLASHAVVPSDGVGPGSLDWDLAFDGYDIFTNGGASGKGRAGAIGPFEPEVFASGVLPEVPFYYTDKPGGAFLDWYAYEMASHALYSRYHVVGVRHGDRLFKVQILGYYGERAGAPVDALYKLRYAELAADGTTLATQELSNLDGTAGGVEGKDDAPSECIDLPTGTRVMLSPEAAKASKDWTLCFRRDRVSVNGEAGGPGSASAVDLSEAETRSEAIADVKARTADSEKARFESVGRASFDGKVFRGDRIVSGFGDGWVEPGSSPKKPVLGTWIMVAADGRTKYFVAMTGFEAPTDASPGTVVLRIKVVGG